MANKTTKLSSNMVIAICAGISLLVLIVFFAAGHSFLSRIGHNARVIGQEQIAQKQLTENLANLPGLAQAYQNLNTTQTLVTEALPDTSDFPSLVATMEVVAGASNVGLNSVSPVAVSTTPAATSTVSSTSGSSTGTILSTPTASITALSSVAPQPFGFSMSVKGSYSAMLAFLSNLQLSARPIKITDMQLTGTTTALSGEISAQTYYLLPPVLADKTETVK